jgi:hypothetical protein
MTTEKRLINPFLPRKADNLKPEQVIGFFANHSKCAPVQERGHHLVIGASGTGKTIGFRYLSLKDQLRGGNIISSPPEFVGIYVSLKTDVEIWRRKKNTDDVMFFYENYLNLTIGYEIVSLLRECSSRNLWGMENHRETKLSLIKDLLGLEESISTFEEMQSFLSGQKREIVKYVNSCEMPQKTDFGSTISSSIITFVPSLCEGMVETSKVLKENEVPFYLFLDYYDELKGWQQKIVNTLIQRPSERYFVKLGLRPFGIYDWTTITRRSIVDALEGRIYLQYFRNELDNFRKVVLETVARRLEWSIPCDEEFIRKLLPEENPLETGKEMGLKYRKEQPSLFKLSDLVGKGRVSEQLEKMAITEEERRKLKSCIYQGFERLSEISEGNIGIFMELCADAWENARLRGVKLDASLPEIPPCCQSEAVWNFAIFKYNDVEVCSPDGPYILNLIDRVCEWMQKQMPLGEERSYEVWNIESDGDDTLSFESIERLKIALQQRVFVPTSVEGYLSVPKKLNLCSYYLLAEGVIDREYPSLIVDSESVDKWLGSISDTISKPHFKASKSQAPSKHRGFLSISFREEEPAKTVRKRTLELFNDAPFEIQCMDAETFGHIGSPKLLERIRGFISKKATFCLVEMSNITANTMVELGLIKGQNRRFWSLAHTGEFASLPDWIRGLQISEYSLDEDDNEKYLDIVLKNNIISPLQGITTRKFCPLWHGLTCPYPVGKDASTVYISYPEEDEIWSVVIKELKEACDSLKVKLVTDKDIKPSLSGTPHIVCVWCYAVRYAGIVFVDTTPYTCKGETRKGKKEGDATRCFILGLAFGQRARKGTLCVHLFRRNFGEKITLWRGYPEPPWSTKDELVKIVKRIIKEKRGKSDTGVKESKSRDEQDS